MIRSVAIGEEIIVSTQNKIGLLADISVIAANNGINISAMLGYEEGRSAKVLFITDANLRIINELRKKRYKLVKEKEVVVVDISNKPGALKVVATELKNNKIDIEHVYVTSCSCGGASRMILQTGDNEKTMSLLARYAEKS